jgi:hypothetical protein
MATVATIMAIVVGPILAVRLQKLFERTAERRDEQRKLFMTLMSARGRAMAPEHVQALNMIDVVFADKTDTLGERLFGGKKNRAVLDAWHQLNDHFGRYPEAPAKPSDGETTAVEKVRFAAEEKAWTTKSNDLLVELLSKMAGSLGYHYDNAQIERGACKPQAEVFLGLRALPTQATEVARDEVSDAMPEAVPSGAPPLQVEIAEDEIEDTSSEADSSGAPPLQVEIAEDETPDTSERCDATPKSRSQRDQTPTNRRKMTKNVTRAVETIADS